MSGAIKVSRVLVVEARHEVLGAALGVERA
jgi:hypothetical protein